MITSKHFVRKLYPIIFTKVLKEDSQIYGYGNWKIHKLQITEICEIIAFSVILGHWCS